MSLPHLPILAAADMQEVIFVIVFLVVGFLQWLFSLFKQKKADAERAQQTPPSEEELEARRRAWENQTRPVDEPPTHPTPAAPNPLGELIESLRRSIDEVSGPTPPPAPRPVQTPPLPQYRPPVHVQQPSRVQATMTPPLPVPRPHRAGPVDVPSVSSSEAPVKKKHPLTEMLQSTHGYRQAFILREVLGPCKALEDEPA
ncbi:MAG: hypothetical protein ACAI34_15530 [Verrucomicrobium sp.]